MIAKDTVFLVVDDISAMRNSMVSLLRGMEMENVVSAGNGKDALHIIERQRVDIVLCDWNMPIMSGLELLKTLRSNPDTAQLPFVMITAEADHGRISEAIAAGVTDLLVKPYTSSQLVSRVEGRCRASQPPPKKPRRQRPQPAARTAQKNPPSWWWTIRPPICSCFTNCSKGNSKCAPLQAARKHSTSASRTRHPTWYCSMS